MKNILFINADSSTALLSDLTNDDVICAVNISTGNKWIFWLETVIDGCGSERDSLVVNEIWQIPNGLERDTEILSIQADNIQTVIDGYKSTHKDFTVASSFQEALIWVMK